jgi:hypothetical protein
VGRHVGFNIGEVHQLRSCIVRVRCVIYVVRKICARVQFEILGSYYGMVDVVRVYGVGGGDGKVIIWFGERVHCREGNIRLWVNIDRGFIYVF